MVLQSNQLISYLRNFSSVSKYLFRQNIRAKIRQKRMGIVSYRSIPIIIMCDVLLCVCDVLYVDFIV